MIETNGLEKSRKNYVKATSFLAIMAEQVTQVTLPDQTLQQWQSLISAYRIIDDRIDHTPEADRNELTLALQRFMHGTSDTPTQDIELRNSLESVSNLSNQLPHDKKSVLIRSLSGVLKVTEKLKQETDPNKVFDLRRLEGQLTARSFLAFLPTNFGDRKAQSRLNRAFTRLGRVGNNIDLFMDFSSDHSNGIIQIKPSLGNRLRLIGSTLPDTVDLLKQIKPTLSLMTQALSLTKDTMENNSEKKPKEVVILVD